MMDTVVLLHAAATLYMSGVIWFVQIVHYPLLAQVGEDGFSSYEKRHSTLTTWVVAPPMLVELGTALGIVWRTPADVPPPTAYLGLALLAVVWISTWTLQVPRHRTLERGFDAKAHRGLVRTNWIRTAGWTARAGLALWWLGRSIS